MVDIQPEAAEIRRGKKKIEEDRAAIITQQCSDAAGWVTGRASGL